MKIVEVGLQARLQKWSLYFSVLVSGSEHDGIALEIVLCCRLKSLCCKSYLFTRIFSCGYSEERLQQPKCDKNSGCHC